MFPMIQRQMPFAQNKTQKEDLWAHTVQEGLPEAKDIAEHLMKLTQSRSSKSVQNIVAEWVRKDSLDGMSISNNRDVPVLESSSKVLLEIGRDKVVRIDQVETIDKSGIVLRLTSTKSSDSIRLYFRIKGSQLELTSNKTVVAQIPAEGLIVVALMLAATYISANLSVHTRRRNTVGTAKSGDETQSKDTCPRDPNGGNFSFGHDLVCTFPIDGIVTEDGRIYIYVWCAILFVEEIEINALDCCKKHDVDLWCSESNIGAAGADEQVLHCFSSAILNQSLKKMSFACGLLGGYLEVFVIVSALYAILAVFVAWWVNLLHGETLIGYGGRNRDSCLCGGKVPTFFCNNRCRDACAAAGKEADCGNCSWACDYDFESGKAIGFKLIPAKNGKPCCPGTEAWCLEKPKAPLGHVCRDRPKGCYDCEYVCDICYKYHHKFCPNPGVGKIRLDRASNMPCCKGTPKAVIPGFCPNSTNVGNDSERPAA